MCDDRMAILSLVESTERLHGYFSRLLEVTQALLNAATAVQDQVTLQGVQLDLLRKRLDRLEAGPDRY